LASEIPSQSPRKPQQRKDADKWNVTKWNDDKSTDKIYASGSASALGPHVNDTRHTARSKAGTKRVGATVVQFTVDTLENLRARVKDAIAVVRDTDQSVRLHIPDEGLRKKFWVAWDLAVTRSEITEAQYQRIAIARQDLDTAVVPTQAIAAKAPEEPTNEFAFLAGTEEVLPADPVEAQPTAPAEETTEDDDAD